MSLDLLKAWSPFIIPEGSIGKTLSHEIQTRIEKQQLSSPLLIAAGFSYSTHESLQPGDIVISNESYLLKNSGPWKREEEILFHSSLQELHDSSFEKSRIVWGKIGTVRSRPIYPWVLKKIADSAAICAIDRHSFSVARIAQEKTYPFIAIRIIVPFLNKQAYAAPLGRYLVHFIQNQLMTK